MRVTLGAHRALCPRCAGGVQKVGYLEPVSAGGQGDRNNYWVPIHGTAQILTQSKNSDKAMFCICCLRSAGVCFPSGGWFAGWSRET